jgi:hypothetical protein
MSVTIAFMTNYTLDLPNIKDQENTIDSFYRIFKPDTILPTLIFCDEKPLSKINGDIILYSGEICNDYKIIGQKYKENLLNLDKLKHSEFIITQSLCDGYKKAIELCKTPYLFFLEHDWIFLPNITHKLYELTDLMNKYNEINCILFNKFYNIESTFQSIKQVNFSIPLCLTNRQSNNPHLLRIEHAKTKRTNLIKNEGCSIHPNIEYKYKFVNGMELPNYCGGIECELSEFCNKNNNNISVLGTYIYGYFGMNNTIIHTDGCKRALLNETTKVIRL